MYRSARGGLGPLRGQVAALRPKQMLVRTPSQRKKVAPRAMPFPDGISYDPRLAKEHVSSKLKAGFNEALDELTRRGLLLVHDKTFPSLTGLTIDGPIRGSWWAHPLSNDVYMISQQLQHCGDVAMTKLVSGKQTYLHRRLWPHLPAIGLARDAWQLDGLAETAASSMAKTERRGNVRLDEVGLVRSRKELSEDACALAMRLLVFADDIHTESGAHVRRLATWQNWADRHDVPLSHLPAASDARAEFERLVGVANAECSASAFLPWQKKGRST